jgi:hypothetical protein
MTMSPTQTRIRTTWPIALRGTSDWTRNASAVMVSHTGKFTAYTYRAYTGRSMCGYPLSSCTAMLPSIDAVLKAKSSTTMAVYFPSSTLQSRTGDASSTWSRRSCRSRHTSSPA